MLLEKKKVCSNLINAANSQRKTSGLLYRGSSFLLQVASFILLRHVIFFPPPQKKLSPLQTPKKASSFCLAITLGQRPLISSLTAPAHSLYLSFWPAADSFRLRLKLLSQWASSPDSGRKEVTRLKRAFSSLLLLHCNPPFSSRKRRERELIHLVLLLVSRLFQGEGAGGQFASRVAVGNFCTARPQRRSVERGTFFHLLGATGEEWEGEGGQARGYCSCQRRHQREVAKREEGGDKPEKLFRAWRGRESPMGRHGFDRALHSLLWSLGLSPLAHRRPLARKGGGGLAFEGSGEGGLYREPLCVLQYVYAPFLGRHHLLLQLKSNKPKVQQPKKKGLGGGGRGISSRRPPFLFGNLLKQSPLPSPPSPLS